MTCKEISYLIHRYLDQEASREEEAVLRSHISDCAACKQHFYELKKSLAFVQSLSHTKAPAGFTDSVMARLPKEKRRMSWQSRLKRHPFLVAASLFVILMAGSVMSTWSQGQGRFEFSAPHSQHLKVDEAKHTVIVPAGQTVEGDIVVRNGNIQVDGEVKGNVVAIDGEVYMASTAHISGDTEEINKALEWIWYNAKNIVSHLIKG